MQLPNAVAYAGRCDDAVETMLANNLTAGVRRDGVWTGPAKNWGWRERRWLRDAKGRPIHVWIERPDGTVVDPTRWTFEGVWPYVYVGPKDLYDDVVLPLNPTL